MKKNIKNIIELIFLIPFVRNNLIIYLIKDIKYELDYYCIIT